MDKKLNIIKKISIFMALLLISIMSVNAGTTYLNACGKNSAWVNNETYVLNFTQIASGYANTYCFQLPMGTNLQNVTFISLNNQTISIEKTGDFYVFYWDTTLAGTSTWLYNSRIENLYFNNTVSGNKYFIYMDDTWANDGANYPRIELTNLTNIKLNNFHAVIRGKGQRIVNDKFIKLQITNTNYFILSAGFTAYMISNNYYSDSFFDLNASFYSIGFGTNVYTNNMTNSIVREKVAGNFYNSIPQDNWYISSIITGYPYVDSNNDGVSDTSPVYNTFVNGAIYLDKTYDETTYRFIQDAQYGNFFINTGNKIIAVNNDEIGITSNTYDIDTDASFNSNFVTLLFTQRLGINLDTGASIKNTINTNKMYMQDKPAVLWTSSNTYKPFISITSNNILIQDVNFSKVTNENNAQIIGNNIDNIRNNITITKNIFAKSDNSLFGADNYMIKLFVLNFNLNNNTLRTIGNGTSSYEMLNIRSTNANSNIITLNNFTTSNTTASYIFTNNSDTKFYNNYIGSNVLIKDTNTLNVTHSVLYLHTNNKLYCFTLGNFYQNNTGCVDANGDGFCDSSYLNGVITDTKPLSSYPFNYVGQLANADCIIDNEAFNITLGNPINNETYQMVDGTGQLNFTYSQDSGFPDLTCDYIIDGISEYTQTNPSANVFYTQTFTGWIEGLHTYRVECYNAYQDIVSTEITFNITFAGVIPPVEEEGEIGGFGGAFNLSGIFSSSPTESVDTMRQNFQLLDRPLSSLAVIGVLFIFIAVLFAIFAIVFFMVR